MVENTGNVYEVDIVSRALRKESICLKELSLVC